jgi:hypothetical protein
VNGIKDLVWWLAPPVYVSLAQVLYVAWLAFGLAGLAWHEIRAFGR